MKCPKCGFNSFEYYDTCKKCSSDLVAFKQTHSITPMVLPFEVKEMLAAESGAAQSDTEQTIVSQETHDDMFSFDLPDDAIPAPVHVNDDPFNFNEPATDTTASASSASDNDAFANLLETTSQSDESPFAAATPSAAPTPVSAPPADVALAPGEFDLESFSWDDTPTTPAAPNKVELADDFDSLFGDTKETPHK